MQDDARGLPISTDSAEAAAAYDHLIVGYLSQRADTPDRLSALFDADPDFALAHCMKGYFAMLGFKHIQPDGRHNTSPCQTHGARVIHKKYRFHRLHLSLTRDFDMHTQNLGRG